MSKYGEPWIVEAPYLGGWMIQNCEGNSPFKHREDRAPERTVSCVNFLADHDDLSTVKVLDASLVGEIKEVLGFYADAYNYEYELEVDSDERGKRTVAVPTNKVLAKAEELLAKLEAK